MYVPSVPSESDPNRLKVKLLGSRPDIEISLDEIGFPARSVIPAMAKTR